MQEFLPMYMSYKKEYPRRLLYIDGFSPKKGLKYLIDAWSTINV
jgi:hypothetical protein